MGWQVDPTTIVAVKFIADTAGDGFFAYSGAAAPGKLRASVTPSSTLTDPEGNAVVGELTSYATDGTFFYAIASSGNEIDFFRASTEAGPWTEISRMIFSATQVTLEFVGSAAQMVFDNSVPELDLVAMGLNVDNTSTFAVNTTISSLGVTTFGITANGEIVANSNILATSGTPGTPTQITTDAWNTPTPNAGFGSGIKYMLNPDKTVSLEGETITTANTLAGAAIFTLPAGYRPAQNQAFLTPNNFSGYTAPARVVTVSTAGVVAASPAGTAGNFLLADGIRFSII